MKIEETKSPLRSYAILVKYRGKTMERSIAAAYRAQAEEYTRRAESTEDPMAKADIIRLAKAWQVLADNAEKQEGYNNPEATDSSHAL